jgi:hypothetical protein
VNLCPWPLTAYPDQLPLVVCGGEPELPEAAAVASATSDTAQAPAVRRIRRPVVIDAPCMIGETGGPRVRKV